MEAEAVQAELERILTSRCFRSRQALGKCQQIAEKHPQFIQTSQYLSQGLSLDTTPTLNQLWSDVPDNKPK